MFFRRIIVHIRTQNWLAIGIDLIVVIIGVGTAFQITEWNETRKARIHERAAIERLHAEAGEALAYVRRSVANFDDINREQEAAIRALSAGDPAEVDAPALESGLGSLGFYPALSPPRSTYDDLVSGGQFGEIADVAVRQAVSEYYSMLEFFEGQLNYFRQTAIDSSNLTGRGIAMRYAPEREFRLRMEVDAGRVAADAEAMSLLSGGLRNQLVFQEFRRGVLAKAEAMCATLAEAVGRPCGADSEPGPAPGR